MKTKMTTKHSGLLLGLMLSLLLPQAGQCFYNPSTGKWLSRDPIEEGGFELLTSDGLGKAGRELAQANLYAFADNNAVCTFDPLGLKARCCPNPTPINADVEAPDPKSVGHNQIAGGRGSIAQMLISLQTQVGSGQCVSSLTIEGHGSDTHIAIGGKGNSAPAPRFGHANYDTDINKVNATLVGKEIKDAVCLCTPCKIIILSCHVGLGDIPQMLASATGCKVFSPKGFCISNLGHPLQSVITATDPDNPNYNPVGSCSKWGVCYPR
jgi:RHS repeat-associated protein